MSLDRFLAGFVLATVAVAPVLVAAFELRRAYFAGWRGVEARLVEMVLAITVITLVAEALGTVGLFETAPVVVALAATGLVLAIAAGRVGRPRPGARAGAAAPAPGLSRAAAVAAVASVVAVIGAWLARTIEGLDRGMLTVDTVWYHLPVAARFVQTGNTTHLHYLDPDSVTAFFPANSSLLHGVGMLLFGSDLVSTIVNMGWLLLALAAAWAIGKPFGVAPLTTVAVALVLGTPGLVATQPGGAYNDVVAITFVLCAVAITVHNRGSTRTIAQDAVAGLALGLAMGMKFTFVGPAAALAIGLVLTSPRGERLRRFAVLAIAAILTGGYWYVRNAVRTGSLVPSVSLHLGPLELHAPKSSMPSSSVRAFLFDGDAWREFFLPGLRNFLGPVWVVIVGIALAGIVGAIVQRREVFVRMLGWVGVLCVVAYVVIPQYLVGASSDRPVFFEVNVRYATPALAIGAVLLPIAFARYRSAVLGVLVATLVVTQLDPTSWPTGLPWHVFQDRVSGGDAAVAIIVLVASTALLGLGFLLRRAAPAGHLRSAVAVAAAAVVVFAGLASAHDHYFDSRYNDQTNAFGRLMAPGRELHDSRIAVVGAFMQSQYPYYGIDLSNFVQYAGVHTPYGGWRLPANCREWARFLQTGRYDYVAVSAAGRFVRWTESQPDARVAFSVAATPGGPPVLLVYRLGDPTARRHC